MVVILVGPLKKRCRDDFPYPTGQSSQSLIKTKIGSVVEGPQKDKKPKKRVTLLQNWTFYSLPNMTNNTGYACSRYGPQMITKYSPLATISLLLIVWQVCDPLKATADFQLPWNTFLTVKNSKFPSISGDIPKRLSQLDQMIIFIQTKKIVPCIFGEDYTGAIRFVVADHGDFYDFTKVDGRNRGNDTQLWCSHTNHHDLLQQI